MPRQYTRIPAKVRFWEKVAESESGCWLWQGATTRSGYGVIWGDNNRLEYAHRLSYQWHNNDGPKDLDVCHSCDTPACVRPTHLFLGSARANAADMMRKGRHHTTPRRGVDHHAAKLTWEDVNAIRSRYITASGITVTALSKEFGVARSTVQRILDGKLWRV